MGSSDQNSSGVHWCRRGIKFNEVRFRTLRRLWCRARSGSAGFWKRFRRRFQRRSGRLWCRARSSSTGFRRRFWRRSGRLSCRARSGSIGFQTRGQQGSREGSGMFRRRFRLWCRARSSSTGFRRSGRLWCRARSGSTGFRRRCRRRCGRLWCRARLYRFNRVPGKVPKKVPGGFGAEPGQVQQGSGKGFGEGSREGRGGFGAEPGQVQRDLRPFHSWKPS